MSRRLRDLLGPALLAAAAAVGCGTSPPGGGITNGPEPIDAPETAATRTDLPPPSDAASTGGMNATGETSPSGGDAARGGGQRGNDPSQTGAGVRQTSPEAASGTPEKVEASSPNSAAGGTKPTDKIEVGTPRSPQ